jgi:hypothetical protein
MFEKEAEKWVENNLHSTEEDYIKAFKDGAEFGYNKANEWHYVKDGKPKDNEYVLIYTDIKNVYIARLVEDDYFITNKGGFVQMSAVIAWKEIVLPKESE